MPFDQWFRKLPENVQVKVDTRIDRVSLGNFGDRAPVGEGVSELRFFFGPGYRVYYGLAEGQVVLLLGGGTNASQRSDIAEAKRHWRRFKKERGA